MNLTIRVCRIVFDTLFPTAASDVWLDEVDVEVLTRLAHAPVVRLGTSVLAPFPFDNKLVRNTIHAAKFRGHLRASMLLGEALAPFVAEELSERHMHGTFDLPLVIPVPLHKTRERERGFNQAERIASALIQNLPTTPLTLLTNVLVRTKRTDSQAKTDSRQQRLVNVAGAFSVVSPAVVAGRHIILVDDVVTTGATLQAAEEALLAAGAREVMCVAVAH